MIIEIRWHGRGGQGTVTASLLIAASAINEGKVALAFPQFGAERRGAPVVAFTRVSDEKITLPRTPIVNPDVLVVLDPWLLRYSYVYSGLREGGTVVANTTRSPDEIRELAKRTDIKVTTVDATKIAMNVLRRPVVNTAILGAFVKATGIVKLDSVVDAITARFPGKVGELNVEAVKRAYDEAKTG